MGEEAEQYGHYANLEILEMLLEKLLSGQGEGNIFFHLYFFTLFRVLSFLICSRWTTDCKYPSSQERYKIDSKFNWTYIPPFGYFEGGTFCDISICVVLRGDFYFT